jgi:hypothetical protein
MGKIPGRTMGMLCTAKPGLRAWQEIRATHLPGSLEEVAGIPGPLLTGEAGTAGTFPATPPVRDCHADFPSYKSLLICNILQSCMVHGAPIGVTRGAKLTV